MEERNIFPGFANLIFPRCSPNKGTISGQVTLKIGRGEYCFYETGKDMMRAGESDVRSARDYLFLSGVESLHRFFV